MSDNSFSDAQIEHRKNSTIYIDLPLPVLEWRKKWYN